MHWWASDTFKGRIQKIMMVLSVGKKQNQELKTYWQQHNIWGNLDKAA